MIRYGSTASASPPGFLEAKNRRQKARAAGLSPDYWYPVARSEKLRRGEVLGTRFWGRPIAVFRDETGRPSALEDRCAHRQLKLSLGQVKGCNLACKYHGWEYGSDGKVAAIPHDLHGKPFPNLRIQSFPVQEKYGIVWMFPGDAKLASARPLLEIPELDGKDRWSRIAIDCEWKTHHSMVIDNLGDFTPAYRSHKSQGDAKITRCEAQGDRVHVSYETQNSVGSGSVFRRFAQRQLGASRVERCYEYPYTWSSSDDKIKEYCFVLPMDEHTTQAFFLFCVKPLAIPQWLLERVFSVDVVSRRLVTPLVMEDRWACEAELDGYLRNFEAPIAEFNPAVGLFQQLTIRKWEEYLATRSMIHTAEPGKGPGRVAI